MCALLPSIQPRSASPFNNAWTRDRPSTLSVPISTPIRRTRLSCCARAVSGDAAAPPRRVMNSRRLMLDPRLWLRIIATKPTTLIEAEPASRASLLGGSTSDAGRCCQKVFFGWSTKILKTADALRALRLEDPIDLHKNDQRPSYRLQSTLRLQQCLKNDFRGIFGVFRFSTFSTASVKRVAFSKRRLLLDFRDCPVSP